MEWWLVLTIMFTALTVLLLSGLPVAFAFLTLNIIGVIIWMGADALVLIPASARENINVFAWVAVPLFIFMGELLFQTELVALLITALGKWSGKIHGSLSLAAVGSGVVFGMMSGSSISGVAVLGSTLIPEMRARGYSKEMSLGPVLGSGALAMIIPPSILCIVIAILAQVSVAKLLMAGLIPGLILAGFYSIYILVRGHLQPHLAPSFTPPRTTWGERLKALAAASPLSIIILFVLGFIFLGVTTPSEAAATGVAATFLLAIAYRKMTWAALKKTFSETVMVTGMVFMIIMNAKMFSQILAYTGTTGALATQAAQLPVSPIVTVIMMQLVMILMGMFMDATPIILLTVPIFLPIIGRLGFDPIWFGILMLVNVEVGEFTPPFGLLNFVMRGVVPDVSMGDIIKSAAPFAFMGVVLLGVMIAFPIVVTWLPGMM